MKKLFLSFLASIISFFQRIEAKALSSIDGLNVNGAMEELLADMTEDFDNSNFDDSGLSADEKRVMQKLMSSPSFRSARQRQSNGSIKHYGSVVSPDTITSLITNSKGDLNITVKRTGVTINAKLPYILFGLQGLPTKFLSAIKPYLPAGVTISSATIATGDLVITYVEGANSDTVNVSMSGLISYGEFLEAMNQNYFKTKYIRYEVADDANRLSQQAEQISFGVLSALGAQQANQMMPRSRVMSWDYNKGITNLLMPEQKITADFSFVQNIIKVDGYSIAWDVFMSERTNLNKL